MSRVTPRALTYLTALAALLVVPAVLSAQQSTFDKLGLDKLTLTGVGIAYGPVAPKNVVATQSYGLRADYGEIVPHWHILFGVSYWTSRFDASAVQQFVDQLRESIVDPAGDDTIVPDRVRVSDIALEADARWEPLGRSVVIQPFVGFGIGAHIVNAESKLINGTFVESALDNIATGLTGTVGVEVAAWPALGIGVEARYTLLSNVRFGAIRGTVSYHFSSSHSNQGP
ncbi:MAG TPA: outer membrane beta-barrel protein [Gemmatimonadaceae bacterium]